MAFMGALLCSAAPALAQQKTVTGRVTNDAGQPLAGAAVTIKGTTIGSMTNDAGGYTIRANIGQIIQFRYIGTTPEERVVGTANTIDVQLRKVAADLDAVVVTALGETTSQRAIGTAQQTVSGDPIAQTQRPNFINALQGRVAGVEVTSTSGVPGASSLITIRGVSSISSSNQPLMIVDGLPIDNKTMNTSTMASDAPGSAAALSNRGVDFTNRAADINPEDIESITVLKGPEASALYGIDAANGAIVITTKRGGTGPSGFSYSSDTRVESVRAKPTVQNVYGPSSVGSTTFLYFGTPYPSGTNIYDNVGDFFQTGVTQKHNLAFSGSAGDANGHPLGYRVSATFSKQRGVIPTSKESKVNLTGRTNGTVTSWLAADLSMMYAYQNNDQPFKGDDGPLIGLLTWPDTNLASNYLSPAGTRIRLTTAGSAEIDNPFFNVNKNKINTRNNRVLANTGFTVTPFSWGYFKTNIGADVYTNQSLIVRAPESALGFNQKGILDQNDDVTRNISAQTLFNVNDFNLGKGLSIRGFVGHAIQDNKSTVDGSEGSNFLDPNFISINNAALKSSRTVITQRRLVSGFGQATVNFRDYLYLNATGRNDWTSTIPTERNSFFYPGVNGSFIVSDAFPSMQKHMTMKLRAGYAEVGRDAPPYSYRTTLEAKTTAYGGYGYGFTGPNPALKPEFATSYEFGTELGFFDGRLGIDATTFKKKTTNQIVQNMRESYATGFVLFNLNGADTKNHGVEVSVRGTPVQRRNMTWNFVANFMHTHGEVTGLPNGGPESYVSDTWLYGNVRNGTTPGASTMSLTGLFYLRDKKGDLIIDPTTGLPLRSANFIDAGYDRQPKYTVGLTNDFQFKNWNLSFLLDFRRGGDVFNATEHYLTTRGLATSTLDRNTPRVIPGVLRDGKEYTANPTPNNIVVIPALNTTYYTNMSEELFIEKNINWVRLRDITLGYELPHQRFSRTASLFVTATDVFLKTNYTGLDAIANGNDAAVGGSSGVGIDYANFPIPRGFNFGVRLGF
jgi:TonB-linked SusC/RagA family outer membrane protein